MPMHFFYILIRTKVYTNLFNRLYSFFEQKNNLESNLFKHLNKAIILNNN